MGIRGTIGPPPVLFLEKDTIPKYLKYGFLMPFQIKEPSVINLWPAGPLLVVSLGGNLGELVRV